MLSQKTLQITVDEFEYLRAFVQEQTAVVIEPGKQYLAEFRLAPLVPTFACKSINELFAHLRQGEHQQLRAAVVDAMMQNETAFFRDTRPFDTLRTEVLPQVAGRKPADAPLQLVSLGCATGQEAYSLAMIVRSHDALQGRPARIVATDVSSKSIERALAGRYAQIEVNRGVSSALLDGHFTRDGVGWRVRDDLRESVEFRLGSIAGRDAVDGDTDVVLLRNVVSAFDPATRAETLHAVCDAMGSGGFLVLGAKEEPGAAGDRLEPVGDDKSCVYQVR
jgi:chemotaxis protein methyltransferase CheR